MASRNWTTRNVPHLDPGGTNALIWRSVVNSIAAQHDSDVLLEREPSPDNRIEIEKAEHLKAFLVQTCGVKFQGALSSLSALQSWKFLQIAVPPSQTQHELTVSPLVGSSLPDGSPSRFPVRTPQFNSPSIGLQHPNGYPIRDDDINLPSSYNSAPGNSPSFVSHNVISSSTSHTNSPSNSQAQVQAHEPPKVDKGAKNIGKTEGSTGGGAVKGEVPDEKIAEREPNKSDAPYTGREEDFEAKREAASVPPSTFQVSGRRRALLIGINYSASLDRLNCCVRDVVYLTHLLRARFSFAAEEIYVMTDEPHNMDGIRSGSPTRENILEAMAWLMRDARAGDSLFFAFSGHGGNQVDSDGDEQDGMDEYICPVDSNIQGNIIDDDLYNLLVRRVPRGSRLTAVIDACCSGTVLDLPYLHDVAMGTMVDDRTLPLEIPPQLSFDFSDAESFGEKKESILRRALNKVLSLRIRKWRKENKTETEGLEPQPERNVRPDSTGGEVLLISGCHDKQNSDETNISPEGSGVLSYSICDVVERGELQDWSQHSYSTLLKAIQHKVTAWSPYQTPQFSSSHPFNLNSPFVI